MSKPGQIDGRLAGAVALLLALLVMGGGVVFAGVLAIEAKQLEIEARQGELEVLKRRNRPAPPARSDERPLAVDPFLPNENPALSANALQKRIIGLVEDADGTLVRVGVDTPTAGNDEPFQRISVHIAAELTNSGLQKVLYDLESKAPFVFIDSLAISRPDRGDDAAKAAEREPHLTVSMSATGYYRK